MDAPCYVNFERRFYHQENKFLKNKTCYVTNMDLLTYFEVNSKLKPVYHFSRRYITTARCSANVESILPRIHAIYKWQILIQRIVRLKKKVLYYLPKSNLPVHISFLV